MKKITKIVSSFLNVDFPENILSEYSQDELHRIKIVNYLCVISIFYMLLYVGIYSILDFNLFSPAIIFILLSSLLTIGVIFINKNGFYNTAKILLAIFTPFYMTVVAAYLFDKSPGFHIYLLLACTIPVFIWSVKHKGYLFFFIIIYFILYLILEFFGSPFKPQIIIPDKFIRFFYSSNIIFCFMGMGVAVGFYQWFINIKEKQLIKQADELRISQKHKDIVYSIIAHDLKGPIGSIVGLTDYFLTTDEDFDESNLKLSIRRMNETSDSLHTLLENLLDWSKMQSGKLEQNKSDFNIREMAKDAIRLYHELSKEKDLSIEVDIDSNIKGNADNYMISTVFRNLISNAIKFTPNKGSILVSAKTKHDEVEICVSDSGVGMPEVDIENLFDIQKTFENSLVSADKGSGLGLLICKDFIESNQGKIWVKSGTGKGCKFYFTLKLAS